MNSNCSFFITLLIISFSSLLFAAQNPTCNPKDQIAINKIQTAFGLTPTPNCCDWDAVTCSDVAPFRVTQFSISNNSTISGQIPAAIGDLSSLEYFSITGVPNLTGNIPPAITKLINLTNLIITQDSLSGPIPAFLGNLKNLQTLDLGGNALTGSIPPQLSQLGNLTFLGLNTNKLTGSIPESLGDLSDNLRSLFLYGNKLTSIPKSLGNLNLITVQLSENSFTGDASFLFGKNKITTEIDLNRNNLSFDLSNVEFPLNLANLRLDNNHIFGIIPQQITQLDFDFGNINVSHNDLCGPIPQGGGLQAFGSDAFSHNKCLCDNPLPPCKRIKKVAMAANLQTPA